MQMWLTAKAALFDDCFARGIGLFSKHQQIIRVGMAVMLVILALAGCSGRLSTPITKAPTVTFTPELPTFTVKPATFTPLAQTDNTLILPTATLVPSTTKSLGIEPTPTTQSNQADLEMIDLNTEYEPSPQTVEGSPVGTVYAHIRNNGPSTLTNADALLSCTSYPLGQTLVESDIITKTGVIKLDLAPGQSENLNTSVYVNDARSGFDVSCSVAFDHDTNLRNNTYTKKLP